MTAPPDKDWSKTTTVPKEQAFLQAIATNDLATVEKLLADAPGLASFCEETPLRIATENGFLSIVQKLLETGANVNGFFGAPLREAAANNHIKTVRYLIENGADTKQWDSGALREAASNGHNAVVTCLLQNGADTHAVDEAALRGAILNNHIKTAETLLQHGADPNASASQALIMAAERNQPEFVRLLLAYSADADARAGLAKRTAQAQGFFDVFEALQEGPMIRQKRLQDASAEKLKELFGEKPRLSALRDMVAQDGTTGIMIAARAGRLAEIARENAQYNPPECLSPDDLLQQNENAESALSTLSAQGQLGALFTPDIWGGNTDGFHKIWREVPDCDKAQVDYTALVNTLNRRQIQERRTQLNKPRLK